MIRRIASLLFLLLLCQNLSAQGGLLGAIDRYTRQTRIGRAGVPPVENPFVLPETRRSIPRELPAGPGTWSAGQDFGFIRYLLDNKLGTDAAALLGSGLYQPSDTLSYLCGTTLFSLKELDGAALWFGRVPETSALYGESLFYGALAHAHLQQFAEGQSLLDRYDGPYAELCALQKAGIALLQGDADAFRRSAEAFSFQDFRLEEAETTFGLIARDRFDSRRKSPALAAALSTVIPGAGKVYAGQLGEGVASFLSVGTFAALTAENWVRKGPRDWQTILFGSLTALTHLANIYGSYVSVSLYYDELNTAQNATILYHIHVPLRLFWR